MKPNPHIPKLTLVGAGPGDPDLITVKGIKALADADVILYDALASKELLRYARTGAKKIFVGKRAGLHSVQQREINKLIVRYAKSYGHVVRLKGGDPFVFGRGLEELNYAESHGLQTEIIPGISSAMAVPALQKIPLTHRGVSNSFWVVTGTTSTGQFAKDLRLAAQSDATVVILMGMKKLNEIMAVFSSFNKGATPVAIIQNGSQSDEKVGFGTVANIVNVAMDNELSSPAIILVGEIVRHTKKDQYADLINEFEFTSVA